MELCAHIQALESEVYLLQEKLKDKSFLLRSLITAKQNANVCSALPTTPEKSMLLSPISEKQTSQSNKNIDFHIDNGLLTMAYRSNNVKKVFLSSGNNHIKGNKIENQTIYDNNDNSHTTTKSKNNNNNSNNTNSNNNNDNIKDTITPNPSGNEPPDQSTAEWKIRTALVVGDSMIAGLREAKLSRNRKVKICFLPCAKTEDLMFHLISYLYMYWDN